MKGKNSATVFGLYFFQQIVLHLLILVFIMQLSLIAQTTEFPVGTFHRMEKSIQGNFTKLNEFGFNSVIQYGNANTLNWANVDNFLAENSDGANDVINHYSRGYYTMWEAEKTQTNPEITGLLHFAGQPKEWNQKMCWSTFQLTAPVCSLMYGPHYRQDKKYRLSYLKDTINYNVRFSIALDYSPETSNLNDDVCKLRVSYRYAEKVGSDYIMHDIILGEEVTLKIGDFPANGGFITKTISYFYPEQFIDKAIEDKVEMPIEGGNPTYDNQGNNGIEFQVDWLGGDNTLYIDYVEIFDQGIWQEFINNPDVSEDIKSYAAQYPDQTKLKYWYGCDEPNTIDSFTPMHIVDSLIREATNNSRFMITEFYPPWYINVNGDVFMEKYYNMVKPKRLMIDYYPIQPSVDPPLWKRLESTRQQFQIAQSLDPDFWYVAQVFGWQQASGD